MKIIQITPGSGDNFYCENCLRDNVLVRALRDLGHDAVTVPLYLPLQSDSEERIVKTPIFFGGINVYLQQKFSLFRKTPRWIDKIFDWRRLLKIISRKAEMTNPSELGKTTLSMLQGEKGRQVKELERLVDFLVKYDKPDIVILSNSLLIGLVRRIKAELKVPVVCLLQDEDAFIDSATEPFRSQCWKTMSDRGKEVDAFVSVSDYYAGIMKERMNIPASRMNVIRMGVDVKKYAAAASSPSQPTVGFLSRECKDKGLHTLVDAFLLLKKREGLEYIKLKVAGGKLGSDNDYVDSLVKKLKSAGVFEDVEFLDAFSLEEKVSFFQGLSVLSVPEVQGEACGFYVVEAAAAGVPFVQPGNGVFLELVKELDAGCLFEPNNSFDLAEKLEPFLLDPSMARGEGIKCRRAVQEKLSIEKTARKFVGVLRNCLEFHGSTEEETIKDVNSRN